MIFHLHCYKPSHSQRKNVHKTELAFPFSLNLQLKDKKTYTKNTFYENWLKRKWIITWRKQFSASKTHASIPFAKLILKSIIAFPYRFKFIQMFTFTATAKASIFYFSYTRKSCFRAVRKSSCTILTAILPAVF